MKIRQATIKDVGQVSRLWLHMVAEIGDNLCPNVDWWRTHIYSFLNAGEDKYNCLVAEKDGGEIVGFLDFFIFKEPATSKTHGVGQHFFVKMEERKKGVSWKLYRSAISKAKKLGAEVFELMCFQKELPAWSKKGFESVRVMVRKNNSNGGFKNV